MTSTSLTICALQVQDGIHGCVILHGFDTSYHKHSLLRAKKALTLFIYHGVNVVLALNTDHISTPINKIDMALSRDLVLIGDLSLFSWA